MAFPRQDIWRTLLKYSAVQSQKAVSAYFTSKQAPPFGLVEQNFRY